MSPLCPRQWPHRESAPPPWTVRTSPSVHRGEPRPGPRRRRPARRPWARLRRLHVSEPRSVRVPRRVAHQGCPVQIGCQAPARFIDRQPNGDGLDHPPMAGEQGHQPVVAAEVQVSATLALALSGSHECLSPRLSGSPRPRCRQHPRDRPPTDAALAEPERRTPLHWPAGLLQSPFSSARGSVASPSQVGDRNRDGGRTVDFETAAQRQCYERVKTLATEIFGEDAKVLDEAPMLVVPGDSVAAFVHVVPWATTMPPSARGRSW